MKKFKSIINFIKGKIPKPIKIYYNSYCSNSPLKQNNNLYSKLTINRYKILTLNTLFIYPVITFLLLLPILYNKTGFDYVKNNFQITQIINQIIKSINMNNSEFHSLLQLFLYIFICCCLVYMVITIIFINKIKFSVDLLKQIFTLALPICIFCGWGNTSFNFINGLLSNKNHFSTIVLLIIIINTIFSKIFKYINSYSNGKWYIKNHWLYGLNFNNTKYYIVNLILILIFYIPYSLSWLNNLYVCISVLILCSFLLFKNTVLLNWSRTSVNNLIGNILGIITIASTSSTSSSIIIHLKLYVCFMLALYLTEQMELWSKRVYINFNSKEKKYILDSTDTFLSKIASNYGVFGSILLLILAILESILHIR